MELIAGECVDAHVFFTCFEPLQIVIPSCNQMDLNIIIEEDGQRDDARVINEKLSRCFHLGHNTISLAVVIDCHNNTSCNVPEPPELDKLSVPSSLKVYTRLTIKIIDSLTLHKIKRQQNTSKYDLIAIEPVGEKMYRHVCSGSTEVDIVTFDMSQRLDYSIFKVGLRPILDRGTCVEINYGQGQLGPSSRRNLICNAQNLTEKVRKSIILSSGVKDTFRIRGPKDAKSIGSLFLLSSRDCHESVYKNAQRAIEHSKHRKNPTSSVIREMIEP